MQVTIQLTASGSYLYSVGAGSNGQGTGRIHKRQSHADIRTFTTRSIKASRDVHGIWHHSQNPYSFADATHHLVHELSRRARAVWVFHPRDIFGRPQPPPVCCTTSREEHGKNQGKASRISVRQGLFALCFRRTITKGTPADGLVCAIQGVLVQNLLS